MQNIKIALPVALSVLLLATAIWFPGASGPEAISPLGAEFDPPSAGPALQLPDLEPLASSGLPNQRQGVPDISLPPIPTVLKDKTNPHIKRAPRKRPLGLGAPSQQELLAQQARMNAGSSN